MTAEVAAELGHTKKNDGTFWMLLEHFKKQVQYVGVNYDTDNWYHDYFLALDDNKQGSTAGKWNFCGSTCTRYIAKVKNMSETESNVVHVGAHTWRPRSIPTTGECSSATRGRSHSIIPKGGRTVYTFSKDGRWTPKVTLEPGQEIEYIVEIDLDREEMSKDWSITAWGENAPVKINVANRTSSTFNVITEDNTMLPEDEGREGDGSGNDDTALGHAEAAEKYAKEAAEHEEDCEEGMSAIRQLIE
jgi:hypothetical protein